MIASIVVAMVFGQTTFTCQLHPLDNNCGLGGGLITRTIVVSGPVPEAYTAEPGNTREFSAIYRNRAQDVWNTASCLAGSGLYVGTFSRASCAASTSYSTVCESTGEFHRTFCESDTEPTGVLHSRVNSGSQPKLYLKNKKRVASARELDGLTPGNEAVLAYSDNSPEIVLCHGVCSSSDPTTQVLVAPGNVRYARVASFVEGGARQYVVGGVTTSDAVFLWDSRTNQWKILDSAAGPRATIDVAKSIAVWSRETASGSRAYSIRWANLPFVSRTDGSFNMLAASCADYSFEYPKVAGNYVAWVLSWTSMAKRELMTMHLTDFRALRFGGNSYMCTLSTDNMYDTVEPPFELFSKPAAGGGFSYVTYYPSSGLPNVKIGCLID